MKTWIAKERFLLISSLGCSDKFCMLLSCIDFRYHICPVIIVWLLVQFFVKFRTSHTECTYPTLQQSSVYQSMCAVTLVWLLEPYKIHLIYHMLYLAEEKQKVVCNTHAGYCKTKPIGTVFACLDRELKCSANWVNHRNRRTKTSIESSYHYRRHVCYLWCTIFLPCNPHESLLHVFEGNAGEDVSCFLAWSFREGDPCTDC